MGCYHRPYVSASKARRQLPLPHWREKDGMRGSETRLFASWSQGIRSGAGPFLRGEIEFDDFDNLIPADGVIKVV